MNFPIMNPVLALLFVAFVIADMSEPAVKGELSIPMQSQKPLFSFGIIADVQYCNCEPAGTRFYSSSLNKLREAMSSFRSDSAEFIINLGDLIDRDIESFKPVLNIIDSSGIKTYHIAGNHDYSVEPRFKRRIPLPLKTKEGYYSFSQSNFRFIALNGNEVSTYASNNKIAIKQAGEYIAALKKEMKPNAVDWNGGISSKQLVWLKEQLKESVSANEKVIILCHFPIFPENAHNLLNYRELISTLEDHQNILAWFSGHNHAGNYGNFNFIHCINLKGMVETESTNSFALVEVYHNKIWIKGSGRERSQILAY
jgi:predicted phosphodiesterase